MQQSTHRLQMLRGPAGLQRLDCNWVRRAHLLKESQLEQTVCLIENAGLDGLQAQPLHLLQVMQQPPCQISSQSQCYTTNIRTHSLCYWHSRRAHASDICCCLASPDSTCNIGRVPMRCPDRHKWTLLIREDVMHVSPLLPHNRAAIDFSGLQNL